LPGISAGSAHVMCDRSLKIQRLKQSRPNRHTVRVVRLPRREVMAPTTAETRNAGTRADRYGPRRIAEIPGSRPFGALPSDGLGGTKL
jgi:hypothetical protein